MCWSVRLSYTAAMCLCDEGSDGPALEASVSNIRPIDGALVLTYNRSDALVAARFVRLGEPASNEKDSETGGCCSTENAPTSAPAPRPTIPPFILSHELARGGMQILQSFFGYALMLAVM